MCVDCLIREIPGNEGYDCDVIVKDLTSKKIDCRDFINKNFKEFSKEYIEKLKKKRRTNGKNNKFKHGYWRKKTTNRKNRKIN